MGWRSVAVVIGLTVLAAVALPGCGPQAVTIEACGKACGADRMAALTEAGCMCANGDACSVDRLLVTPVPPGPDGRERKGGRLAAAGVGP